MMVILVSCAPLCACVLGAISGLFEAPLNHVLDSWVQQELDTFTNTVLRRPVVGLHVRVSHPQIVVTKQRVEAMPACAQSKLGHGNFSVFLASNNMKAVLPLLQHAQAALNTPVLTYSVQTVEAQRMAVGSNAVFAVLEMLALSTVDLLVAFSGSTFSSASSLLAAIPIIDERCV
jgi:hypothetical protein